MSQAEVENTPFWLKDNFAPVFEETTAENLTVRGTIPSALNGRLLRNGANPQTGESLHWFLGNGMLHGVEISEGSANWYRNRYVKTPLYLNPDADIMSGLGDMSMSAAADMDMSPNPDMMSASGFKYSGVFTYRLRYQFAEPSEISTPCNMPLPKNQCSDSPVCGLAPFLRSRPFSALGMVPLTVRFSAVVSSKTGAKLSFNQNGVFSTSA